MTSHDIHHHQLFLVLKGLGVSGRGWPSSPLNVPTISYRVIMTTRRRHGEDGIYFEHRGTCRDPQRHRNCPAYGAASSPPATPATGNAPAAKSAALLKPPLSTSSATCTTSSTPVSPPRPATPITLSGKPPTTGSPMGSRAAPPKPSRRTRTSSNPSCEETPCPFGHRVELSQVSVAGPTRATPLWQACRRSWGIVGVPAGSFIHPRASRQ
jgi:hypothetical protein